ncbi:MAG TPA: FAD-binding protein, partial [Saprospiraceae bacterium]|nr:FAD-binding protein [Saprospiraceae bacterium]
MEKIDYLIIGQGIAGTTLSYNILQRGKTCHVASDDNSISSSYISAGVINPVTGRRIVKSWMIDELM